MVNLRADVPVTHSVPGREPMPLFYTGGSGRVNPEQVVGMDEYAGDLFKAAD